MTTLPRLAYVTLHAAAAVSQRAVRVGVPVARVVMESGRLPARMPLHHVTEVLAHRARGELATLTSEVERLIAAITVKLVDDLLNQLDLTAIIGERVDLWAYDGCNDRRLQRGALLYRRVLDCHGVHNSGYEARVTSQL